MTREPTAEQYPICAGCECPDGQCECVECTEYKGPAKPVSNVYRSDYIGINPTRPYLHDFRIGDIVRCLDSEPDLIDALSGQMFVRLARSGAYVNHESLTLVSTEYRLYTMQQAIYRIVDWLVLEWEPHTAWAFVATTILHDSGKDPRGLRYYVDHRGDRFMYWIGANLTCHQCESIEHGQQLCLEDYKARFQAEIEKAVKS